MALRHPLCRPTLGPVAGDTRSGALSSTGYKQSVSPIGGGSPQISALAFGSVTGTTPATANTVLTATRERVILVVENTTDADLVLTVDGDDLFVIRTASAKVIDLGCNGLKINLGEVIGVYRRSGAPTSGEILVQAL